MQAPTLSLSTEMMIRSSPMVVRHTPTMAAEIGQISLQVCSSRVDSDLAVSDWASLLEFRLLPVVGLR